jgi:hypothetical protein
MRALAGVIFGTAIIFSAEPTWAQTYDPKYPVCMEVNAGEDSHIECWFTSMEQCKNGSTGTVSRTPITSHRRPNRNPLLKLPPSLQRKQKRQRSDLIRNSGREFGLESFV